MVKLLIIIGVVWATYQIWTAKEYLLVTPSPVLTNQFIQVAKNYINVVHDTWKQINPKKSKCDIIKGKYKIQFNQSLSFFMGRMVIGQGCSPIDVQVGCFYTINLHENNSYLTYSGQHCLLSGFK